MMESDELLGFQNVGDLMLSVQGRFGMYRNLLKPLFKALHANSHMFQAHTHESRTHWSLSDITAWQPTAEMSSFCL